MKPKVSIGSQNFEKLIVNHYFYVDKTDFIKEWWEEGDDVTLINRPRRFGKTLNLSMTEVFFSAQYSGRGDLFEGFSIWEDEKYRRLQGTYPVIFLSFANVKEPDFAHTRRKICQLITNLYMKNSFLMDGDFLRGEDRKFFESISVDMDDNAATMSLHQLTDYLSRYYGKNVILLLDEYDTPLQEAYVNGFWDEMTLFIRSLFNAAFKTNPHLERGLLTGVTRISRESVFSDLNNLEVVTTTSGKYETAFGFTEEEVAEALRLFGLLDKLEKVKYWYDGFHFGSRDDIYNPWSITKYLDSERFGNYWANTSSNNLVGKLIREGSPDIKIAVEDLLEGKVIEKPVDEEIVFSQLDENDEAIWSLLLASGYLRVEEMPEEGGMYCLSLTNHEVRNMFRKMIRDWFGKSSARYNDFVKALFADDVVYMNRYMNEMTASVFSFFDTGSKPSGQDPERFYHGFVLGLIADAGINYRITSNRKSGFGRYDVVMEPENQADPAYIFEFKVHDPAKEHTMEDTVRAAHAQIEEKNYDAALISRGFARERIRHYGFAFEGKKVLVG